MATRGGRRPRFEPRSRHEDAAHHSTLTLRKVRAVLELRHVEVELSFEQRPRGCGPSSNYDTELLHRWVDTLSSYPQGTMCCVVALLCCAALRCCAVLHCCVVTVRHRPRVTTLSCYLVVDTLSSNPTVTTPSCYCAVLHCCAALLCCTAVLHCCAALLCSVRRPLRVTTELLPRG